MLSKDIFWLFICQNANFLAISPQSPEFRAIFFLTGFMTKMGWQPPLRALLKSITAVCLHFASWAWTPCPSIGEQAKLSSSDTLTWQVMSKMIYLTSSESADPHHLGQIRGVGRQLHHHGAGAQSSIMPIGTRYEPMEYRIGNGSQLDRAAAEK